MTHGGAQFIREELQTYKSTCQKRKSGWTQWEMHATHTFVPLGAGSPVFGGSLHIIINYADKFPSKLFQPQLLRGESWIPPWRRVRRELGFQENRTYGIILQRECARKRASMHTQGEICSRVKTQLGYDLYWEGQYNLRRAHEFKKLDLVFDKNWLLYIQHSSSFYKVNCSLWPVHAEHKSMRVFPGGSVGKELVGSIPGLGRSPGEGNGNPPQYACWEIPWTEEPGGLVHGVTGVGH